MAAINPAVRDLFSFAGDAFFAQANNKSTHRRATLPELRAILRPSGYDTAVKDPVSHWWEAQCLHYGLPTSKTKAVAKTRLLDALNSRRLNVPANLTKLEAGLKKQWKKDNELAKPKKESKVKTATDVKTTTKTTTTTTITTVTTTKRKVDAHQKGQNTSKKRKIIDSQERNKIGSTKKAKSAALKPNTAKSSLASAKSSRKPTSQSQKTTKHSSSRFGKSFTPPKNSPRCSSPPPDYETAMATPSYSQSDISDRRFG
jgi:hypothetical protein